MGVWGWGQLTSTDSTIGYNEQDLKHLVHSFESKFWINLWILGACAADIINLGSFSLNPSSETLWRIFAKVWHQRHTWILFPQLIYSTGCTTFLVFGEIIATPETLYTFNVSTLYDRHDSLQDETYGTHSAIWF